MGRIQRKERRISYLISSELKKNGSVARGKVERKVKKSEEKEICEIGSF